VPHESRPKSKWQGSKQMASLERISSSLREERDSIYDTCANGVLGSVKMRFGASSRQAGRFLNQPHYASLINWPITHFDP